jgi:DNA-binding XRE family transcriptional regulator
MKILEQLLAQLSPTEKNGAILEIQVPKGTLQETRSPTAILEATREAVFSNAINQALKQIRQQAGLRSKDMAKALKVSPARVTQIESINNNITLETLVQHAQAANCEVEIILRPKDKNLPEIRTAL